MNNVLQTVLNQYANSPRLCALIESMNASFDPAPDIDAFYDTVWNVATAQGFGLDLWGRIVDAPRQITLTPLPEYLGFAEGRPGAFPFDQRPFATVAADASPAVELSDEAYRLLILTKAAANISDFTAPRLNAMLCALFAGRGNCYVRDPGAMQIEYVFHFALEPWEAAVLLQPDLLPRPAGVSVTLTVLA